SSINYLIEKRSVLEQIPGTEKLALNTSLDKLSGSLGQSNLIQRMLQEKQSLFNEKLSALGLTHKLKVLNKTAYYYREQVEEYKSLLKDPKKLVRRGLDILKRTKEFQNFFKQHAQLASLFNLPGNSIDPNQIVTQTGLHLPEHFMIIIIGDQTMVIRFQRRIKHPILLIY